MGIGCKPCHGAHGAVYSWSHASVAVPYLMPALLQREAACATWQVLVVLSAAVAYTAWEWLHAQLARVQRQGTALPLRPLLITAVALGLLCWLVAYIRRASRSVGYLQTTHWGTLGARSSCSTAAARDAPPSCLSDQGAAEQPRTVRKAPGPSLSPEQSRAVTCSVQHLLQAVAGPWDAQAVHQQLQVLAKLAHMEEAGQHIVQQRGAGCVADAMARAASVAAAATSPAGGGDGLKPSTQEAEQHVVLEGSWVLLQLAGSAPEVAGQLQYEQVLQQLRRTLELVCPPPAGSPAFSAAVRNIIWTCYLLTLQEAASSSSSRGVAMTTQQRQQIEAAGRHPTDSAAAAAAAEAAVQHARHQQSSEGAAAALLHECGMLAVLQREALSLQCGPLPAVLAVATLGNCLTPIDAATANLAHASRGGGSSSSMGNLNWGGLSEHDVQSTNSCSSSSFRSSSIHSSGNSSSVCSLAGRAAADALCSKDGSRAMLLGWLQQGLEPGLCRSLHHALLALTRRHPQQLLRSLIEQQLLGSFLQAVPQDIASRLVCQLVSSAGQQMLMEVEAAHQLDVAVALAQVIPLPCHMVLPALPGEQWLAGGDEVQTQGTAAGTSPHRRVTSSHRQPADSNTGVVSTQLLACRLLLQHQRLPELLLGYAAELLQVAETSGAAFMPAGNTAAAVAADLNSGAPGGPAAPIGMVPSPVNGQDALGGGSIQSCGMCQRADCPRRAAAVAAVAPAGAGARGPEQSTSIASLPLPGQDLLAPSAVAPTSDVVSHVTHQRSQAGGAHLVEPGAVTAVEQLLVHLARQPLQLQSAVAMQGSGFAASSHSSQRSRSTTGSSSGPHGGSLARVSLSPAADGMSWLYTAADGASGTPTAAAPAVGFCRSSTAPGLDLQADGSSPGQRTLTSRRWNSSGSSSNSGRWCTFLVGEEQQVQASLGQVRLLRQASPLLRFLLKDVAASSVQQPITSIAVPHFSPDVNAGVLRQLLGWVEMQHLSPNLGHVHLAQLWVAADLFQVDTLRGACEDCLAAGLPQGPGWVEVVLQLCDQHHHASARLQTLVLRALMAGVGGWLPQQQLRAYVVQYTALLVPGMVRELRDMLTAKCLLSLE